MQIPKFTLISLWTCVTWQSNTHIPVWSVLIVYQDAKSEQKQVGACFDFYLTAKQLINSAVKRRRGCISLPSIQGANLLRHLILKSINSWHFNGCRLCHRNNSVSCSLRQIFLQEMVLLVYQCSHCDNCWNAHECWKQETGREYRHWRRSKERWSPSTERAR